MEFAPFGINVIVAGESYVKNKGITIDPKTKKEYFEILEKIPLKIRKDASKIARAKKYAYHFFFKKSIVPNSLKEEPTKWPIFSTKSNVLDNLKKGNDKPLKSICDSIINYKPFTYDDVI